MSVAPSTLARVQAVAIGGSAGGVEAMLTLLPAIPAALRVPVFVVLHLPRDRQSLLPEIFSGHCARPVKEADDKESVTPGTIYVGPPDYHLQVDEGPRLSLCYDEPINWSRPSIDALFVSAADVYRERLMAILLSGGNQDGAEGLVAVRERGGMTVVQDPASAACPTMPNEALRRGEPDAVWNLEQMKTLLQALQ
ncbi:MAG TPA: chemotaxis protein CheB [Polyangia bacterium]